MSTKTNHAENGKKLYEKYTVRSALVNYYLLLMFTAFPLFVTNAYFNIRHDKYYFFVILSAVMIAVEVFLALSVKKEINNKSKQNPVMEVSDKVWYKTFSFTDWAMIAFFVTAFVSTLISKYPLDSVLGTAGRNNGLLLIAIYVGIYFLITRCYYYMDYVFLALAGASAIVYLLAIVNCFYIDPFGMFNNLDAKTIADFTSTIGNKNLLSSYICITLPVFIAMSVYTSKNAYRAVYLALSGLGFSALMTADSDSGILGLSAFIVIYFIWYSKRIARLKRFFLALTVMLLSAKLLRLFSLIMSDHSKGMDDFQKLFVYSNTGFILLAAVAIITAGLYLLDYKKPDITLSNAVPVILGIIAFLSVISIIAAVIYFTCIDTKTDLCYFDRILRFDDKWGTHRGFMWIRSMWIFGDFNFVQKLFGSGPDTFYYAFQPYFADLSKFGDSSTTAAHNEYINYLVTVGITGLAAYCAVIGSTVWRAVKASKTNPVAIVFVAAVICYSVQAVVNIAQPITTPLLFVFIALCEASAKSKDKMNGVD